MPTSIDTTNMTTNWGDTIQGAEQAALSDFAAQLEAHIALDDNSNEEKKPEDIREEAEILLSLLSAKPPSQSIDEDDYTYTPEYQDLIQRDPSFSFSCPLMSLEQQLHCSDTNHQDSPSERSDGSTTTEEGSLLSSTDTTLAPALLLARQKVVGDALSSVEASNKTGDTVARNIAYSFLKAVEWRIQTWIHMLSSIIVKREEALVEAHASDDIIQELLDTAEARVLLFLQKAASEIKLMDTKTTLRVLSQRINSEHGQQNGSPPLKKRKMEELSSSSLLTESEYKYTVGHVLTFESTINLKTPAGYTEVRMEAPGFIQGTFRSSDSGEDTLTDISVEVDTNVLAKAMEKSSRIVARTATHAVMPLDDGESEDEEEEEQVIFSKEQTKAFAPSPTLQTGLEDDEATKAVLVTPHKSALPMPYQVSDGNVPMVPNDFDNVAEEVVRMVSPQPRSPEFMSLNFTPHTPQTTTKTSAEPVNLVSPPPAPHSSASSKTSSEDEASPSLAARKSPSLPALLQVASAAMKAC